MNYALIIFGLVGGVLRIMVGYSKSVGLFGYKIPFNSKRAIITIVVSLIAGAIAPVLINTEEGSVAFIAGFAGIDMIEALAKGLMKIKTGFSTGFPKSRYATEFGQGLEEMGLRKDLQKAVDYCQKNGKITNVDYQRLNKVSRATSARNLNKLEKMGLLKKAGKGKNVFYKIP
jgi:DNA-binding transcriptional ArsR family regulator